MPQQTVYWLILEVLVLVIFVAGLVGNVSFWMRGSVQPGRVASNRDKIGTILRGVGAVLRPHLLGGVLLDVLLQRRLFHISLLRWLMHFCMFWGIIVLFFVGSVGLMLAERGLVPVAKDTPWFALVNDFAGLMVVFGAVVALYRRFVLKVKQLRTAADDVVVMVLLAFIVVSGYGLEGVRMAGQQISAAEGWYSFVGYALARTVMASSLDWGVLYEVAWWFHAVSAMAFVAYIPYSKLFHMFASPLVIAASRVSVRSVGQEEAGREEGEREGRSEVPSPSGRGLG